MTSQITAKVIAHSASLNNEIVTFELEYPRIIHCFDEKTEILSQINNELPQFRTFEEVFNLDSKVAQYDDETGEIKFVTPKEKIKNEGNHSMVSLGKKKFPMLVTDKHRVLTKKRTTGNSFISDTILAEDLLGNYGTLRIEQSGFTTSSCLLTNAEIEFCAWFAADGHSPVDGNKANFHVRKKRKLDEITRILAECGYDYRVDNYDKDYVVRFDKNPLVEGCYTEEGEKKLPDYITGMNKEQYTLFKRALLLSDGNLDNCDYNTNSKVLINQIQVLAHMNEDAMNIHKYGSLYKCSFKNSNYISLRQDKDIFSLQKYSGKVYCVSVDSTYVVVRRDGVVFVSGNCELMTHRLFSRNAASSRAIPVKTLIEMVRNEPAMPYRFGANQPGMQDKGEEHDGIVGAGYSGRDWWKLAALSAARFAEELSEAGYHKQIANRLLEPFQRIKTILTATEFENYWWLRLDKDADPTIHELTKVMKAAFDESEPEILNPGEWHTPYVYHYQKENMDLGYYVLGEDDLSTVELTLEEALSISSSCCAQVSYRRLNSTKDKALDIYSRLLSGDKVHASPFEHQATPIEDIYEAGDFFRSVELWPDGVTHRDRNGDYWSGNFKGFIQHRQLLENHTAW